MKIKKLIPPILVVVIAFVLVASLLSVRCDNVKAEEPTPQWSFGASEVSLGASNGFTDFNNGYSFVFYGTFSNDSNGGFSITTPFLNFDTNLMSMRFNFSNSNVDNRLTVLNVSLFGTNYISDNTVEEFFTWAGVNATSLNSFLNGKIITIGKKYEKISLHIDVAVASGYVEFAFNDFSIDFFSDFKIAYNDGFEDGYNTAKTEYYQSRYDLGYSDGFNEGASGQYSFFALISAVVETPINAVLGMLDFNFLDINLKSFFLSVFTIALIVMILRFVLAKN